MMLRKKYIREIFSREISKSKGNYEMNKNEYLVSIITPTFNSVKYIEDTIKSVITQTYSSWEMNIVDDCSTDDTREIVNKWCKKDSRIRLSKLDQNQGASAARNMSLSQASGRFIAYLDADDIWSPQKLEKQVDFMITNNYGFSCTSYEVIEDTGKSLNKEIYMLPQVDYMGFLTNNLLQTVGIMVDTNIVNKKNLVMPSMRRRQDAATWLQILKDGHKCYGMREILAQYRRAENSLSSNKVKAVKGIWFLYRNVEHLSLPISIYCFVRYAFFAVGKRMYTKNPKRRS